MSRKYENQLEELIEHLQFRIVELKNEVIETKYYKDINYKRLYDKLEKISVLLNIYEKYTYKRFINKLKDIVKE